MNNSLHTRLRALASLTMAFFVLFVTPTQTFARSMAVSIVNLIVNPKLYAGDRVIVTGYVREQGGYLRLYLTREDALMYNEGSSIVVNDASADKSLIRESECHDSYVNIIGEFGVIESLGLHGIVSVESVSRYDLDKVPPSRERCWPRA